MAEIIRNWVTWRFFVYVFYTAKLYKQRTNDSIAENLCQAPGAVLYLDVHHDHKVRTYKEYQSVCPLSELGLPPTPHPQASVPPPPCFWGEGNTRWRERGWESPNSDQGHTLWYSLYVRTLWPWWTSKYSPAPGAWQRFSAILSLVRCLYNLAV